MKKHTIAPLVASLISALLLTACSGGGGGGNSSPAPATESPIVDNSGSTDNGSTDNGSTGSGSDNTNNSGESSSAIPVSKTTAGTITAYTYVAPNGKEYVLRNGGISSGGMTQMIIGGEAISYCCGRLSYTNYGSWSSADGKTAAVFYTGEGTAASAVPTQGSATYTGTGIRGTEVGTASFNVDFAAKTINGTVSGDSAFGSDIAMQGKIVDGGFKGDAQSGGQSGSFIGHFNGPQAEELGGMANFADSKLDASFGAKVPTSAQ